jgi:pimeloyl-ACP methyl ester carboxylesterase
VPTAVLVHGAFHGGWCWRKVSALLAAQGWTVFAPSLTGLGERAHLATADTSLDTHVQDALALFEAEELSDVVLCGHSAGGSVVTAVADRVPDRVSHLIYLDAVIPHSGESVFDVVGDAEGVPAAFRALAVETDGWTVPPVLFTPEAFGVTDPHDAAWLARRMRAHPLRALADPVVLFGAPDLIARQTYVRCEGFPVDYGERMVERASTERKAAVHRTRSGHDLMITDPELVARLIATSHDNGRTHGRKTAK